MNIEQARKELGDIKALHKFVQKAQALLDSQKELAVVLAGEPDKEEPQNPIQGLFQMFNPSEMRKPPLADIKLDAKDVKDLVDMIMEYFLRLSKDKELRLKADILGTQKEKSPLEFDLEETISKISKVSSIVGIKAVFKVAAAIGMIEGVYRTNGETSQIMIVDTKNPSVDRVVSGNPVKSIWHDDFKGVNNKERFLKRLGENDVKSDIVNIFHRFGYEVDARDMVKLEVEKE